MTQHLSKIKSFRNRQSRRPSFSESVVSALNSFSFLDKDEDADRAVSTPPPPPPTCHILPRQWQRVHRALFHHLCALFDMVDLLEKQQLGPLDALQKKSRDIINASQLDIQELMTLMSSPDDILLRTSK